MLPYFNIARIYEIWNVNNNTEKQVEHGTWVEVVCCDRTNNDCIKAPTTLTFNTEGIELGEEKFELLYFALLLFFTLNELSSLTVCLFKQYIYSCRDRERKAQAVLSTLTYCVVGWDLVHFVSQNEASFVYQTNQFWRDNFQLISQYIQLINFIWIQQSVNVIVMLDDHSNN